MHRRHAIAGVLAAAIAVTSACGPAPDPADDAGMPDIVRRSIAYHGGNLYEASRMTMTIRSLSGSFDIEATRDGGLFEYTVTDPARNGRPERRVRLTNDGVTEWIDGEESALDAEGERRATTFVNARVFFPLLPYTLEGSDILFEDLGADLWNGRFLHRVKVRFNPGTSNDADDNYTFWFDEDTGRVEQYGYDFDNGLRFRRATAFERVGGVLFSNQDNYAVDGGRVPVDTLTPDYVANHMRLLSHVALEDVTVEPL